MKKIVIWFFAGMVVVVAVLIAGLGGTSAASSSSLGQTLLASRNVNMVSGTKLPFGDPWLQRQNEPSIAASTRNPLHLLAGANDYRTIDIPDDFKLPGIERTAAADAWLGVYESFNGGESWITTLLPGFPQDSSSAGTLSPLKDYETACDPIVRSGANGLFYFCGIAFNRTSKESAIFVARYVDDNNLEKVEVKLGQDGTRQYSGPIQYIDTRLVATGSTNSSFIDMPNMAVDVPRGSARYGNIYVAYTVFSNTGGSSTADKIFIQKSTDGGVTWSTPPIQLSATGDVVQRPMIAIDPIDLKGNTLYVAFRRFAKGNVPDGIVVVRSTNGGKTFSKLPDVAPSFYPFDQGTSKSPSSFRTNSYPTIAIGDLGTVYVAWSQRQAGPGGQARIMISAFRKGGLVWTPAQVVDQTYAGIGHQFMPSLTFAAWKLMLAWYDQREDKALDASPLIGDSQGGLRHTIDVRAAEGRPGVPPIFSPSIQLSRYLHVLDLDASGNPIDEGGHYKVIQAEYNHINYPLFQLGTVPFHGDYLEVTPSVRILPPAIAFGSWIYNINPFEATSFHTAWTDNRDVRPPNGDTWGDWVNYNAPGSNQDGWPNPAQFCLDGSKTGMRNQNIYTANINKGLIMGSPGNTKQLDLPLTGEGGRTFVVFVKNTTEFERTLNLVILQIGGVDASFDQFRNDDNIQVKVQPYSSVSCTVYVTSSTRKLAPLTVNAFEGLKLVGYVVLNPDPTNLPLSDPDNPFQDLGRETHDPDVSAPQVWNYDLGDQSDPNASAVLGPRVQNPRVQNYSVVNPRVQNEGVLNPRVQNESIVNNEVPNPRVQNTVVPNGALTDVTWTVTNEGNTTSVFTTNIRSQWPDYFNGQNPPLIAQVLVYKVHRVPVDKDCQLYETHQDELIANISNPRVQNPRVQNSPPAGVAGSSSPISIQAADLGAQDITFDLAPGEQAEVTFRVWDEDTTDGSPIFSPDMVIAEAVAEAVNTASVEEGGTTPPSDVPPNSEPWTTPQPQIGVSPLSLSFGAFMGLNPADQLITVWNSGGGALDYTVVDDAAWLSVTPASGTLTPQDHTVSIDVAGLAIGTYAGTISISDPYAANNPLRISVTLTISQATPVPARVSLTGPAKAGAGFISEVFTLTSLDQFGNVIPVVADTTFALTSNSDGVHGFYAAPNEKARTSQVVIPAGSSSAVFYYKDSVPSPGRPVTATWVSGGSDLGPAAQGIAVWAVTNQIAYSSMGQLGDRIVTMQPDGTNLTNLAVGLGQVMWGDISPDGSKVAFSRFIQVGATNTLELYVINADGSYMRRLTNNLLGESYVRWSPDGSRLLFTRSKTDPGIPNHDPACEIFIMDADGSNVQQLTDNQFYDGQASFSPDESKIVFTSERDGFPRVYVMNSDGTGQAPLSSEIHWEFHPHWSPDGSRIAISRANGYACIYVLNSDGTNTVRLTDDTVGGNYPSWSPDGSLITFMAGMGVPWQIFTISADGSNLTRVTNTTDYVSYPSWGGAKIAFDSGGSVCFINPDGTGLTRLAKDGSDPAWSPNGIKIAFDRMDGTNQEIYVMNADGTAPVNISNNPAEDHGARWSPDGSYLVFTSTRDGNLEIYRMKVDGTDVRRLTDNQDDDLTPDWSPDGTKIVYASSSSETQAGIYVMEADGSNAVPLTANEVLNVDPCWSPDGSKIVFSSTLYGGFKIYVMNADGSGSWTQLTTGAGADRHPFWSPNGRDIIFQSDRYGNNELYLIKADGSTESPQRLTDLGVDTGRPSWRTRANLSGPGY
jgi:Tol biopolymer transport system component